MTEQDFPALYRSADKLSLDSQKYFFRVLLAHLAVLVFSAILPFSPCFIKWVPMLQLISLLAAFGFSIYLWAARPDRYWYAGRAVAESVKTISWRYISKAEPFHAEDEIAQHEFKSSLKLIFEQNRDIYSKLIAHPNEEQFPERMSQMRSLPLNERIKNYCENRIKDQYTWYRKRANYNKRMGNLFFVGLVISNAIAAILAILKINGINPAYLPVDVAIALAASILSWIQAKRFTELSASYALTAHEIRFIIEESATITTEDKFSKFVGDAENAFSREHTQWVARRDV